MADAEYRRLTSACFCGGPVLLTAGRGRPRKYCDSHREKSARRVPKPKQPKAGSGWATRYELTCQRCGAAFVAKAPYAKYCGAACRVAASNDMQKCADMRACETCGESFGTFKRNVERRWCSEECKPKARKGLSSCQRCGVEFKRKPSLPHIYCSRACTFAAWADAKLPVFCAYYVGWCADCNKALGARRPKERCPRCQRARENSAKAEAARVTAEAKHKAAGVVSSCDECGAEFCRLYGQQGNTTLCMVCAPIRALQTRKSAKAARRAKERGATAENVLPELVFERDGWRCRMCGINTPQGLRGTYEHNAPELDHILPLARGGHHTLENVQCLCRSCNLFKSDKTEDEVWQALAA